MSGLTIFALAVFGGIGASLRYLADNAVPQRLKQRLPWGTILVNLSGSFVIGIIVGLSTTIIDENWALILSVGLTGGYTTFSATAVESVKMLEEKRFGSALINIFVPMIIGIALAALGFTLTS